MRKSCCAVGLMLFVSQTLRLLTRFNDHVTITRKPCLRSENKDGNDKMSETYYHIQNVSTEMQFNIHMLLFW